MSRKSPLFDPDRMIDDLFVRALSPLTKLFYFQLAFLANKGGDGYLRLGETLLAWDAAARLIGWEGDITAAAREIMAARLIEEDQGGIFVPEIRRAAELREKRKRAGEKGGARTTAGRSDVRIVAAVSVEKPARQERGNPGLNFCSSKSRIPGKPAEIKAFKENRFLKEKRTKKENNNKYIYIFSKKVFMGDAGVSPENKPWMIFENFTVHRREYQALQEEFGFPEEKLDALLARHNRWLDANPPPESRAANDDSRWRAPLLAFLRSVRDGTGKGARRG